MQLFKKRKNMKKFKLFTLIALCSLGKVTLSKSVKYNQKATNQLIELIPLMHIPNKTNIINKAKKLIQAGANPNAQDSNTGRTLLTMAVMYNLQNLAQFLLKKGIDPNIKDTILGGTSLIYAQSPEMLELLLKNKFDPNTLGGAVGGNTILMRAIDGLVNPHLEGKPKSIAQNKVNVIFKYKPNLNIQNEKGETALIQAAKRSQEEMVELLLKHGADPTIKNNEGKTAYDVAGERAYIIENKGEAFKTYKNHPEFKNNIRRILDKYKKK